MAKLEELMPFPAVFHTLFCPALLCAVQPYLERWVQVWAPQCKKDINYERAFKGGLWRWRWRDGVFSVFSPWGCTWCWELGLRPGKTRKVARSSACGHYTFHISSPTGLCCPDLYSFLTCISIEVHSDDALLWDNSPEGTEHSLARYRNLWYTMSYLSTWELTYLSQELNSFIWSAHPFQNSVCFILLRKIHIVESK